MATVRVELVKKCTAFVDVQVKNVSNNEDAIRQAIWTAPLDKKLSEDVVYGGEEGSWAIDLGNHKNWEVSKGNNNV